MLIVNCEHCRSNGENLRLPIEIQLSKKPQTFCYLFLHFGIYMKFPMFWKKKKEWSSWVKYFWNYWLRNMCLIKCITGFLSENTLAVNVLTSPKNSWNLQKSTFILLFLHSEPNWVRKTYFWLDLRF